MRTGLLFLILLGVLSACPPTIDQNCQRLLVDTTGNANGGFGGGPATTTNAPMGLVGSPVSTTVFAPLTACVSDTLRADVTLIDPENLPAPATVDGAPTQSGLSVVRVGVSFTPTKPGLYTLKVSFEPSLGVRSQFLNVASDGLLGQVTRVPLPTGASCPSESLWPLSDDTVACEEGRGSDFISVSSSDGGVIRFAGAELVVADTVLWSIHPSTLSLEQRVFEDGGVRLAHTFPNFSLSPTPAMHDVGLALRLRSGNVLGVVRVRPDGGTSVGELTLDGQPGEPLAYFLEGGLELFRWSRSECQFGCTNLPDLVGVEPGSVWREVNAGFGEVGLPARISGFTRPTTQFESSPRFVLPHASESVTTPRHGFERLPVWLSQDVVGRRVLVSLQDDQLSLTAWPRAKVLRVGRNHVLLSDPDSAFVRVFRK